MPSVIVGLLSHIATKLEAYLVDSKRKALSCYTVEDYLNKSSVRLTVECFYETIDGYLTGLHESIHTLMRIALLKRS